MNGTMIKDYPNYAITDEGQIISYAQNNPKLLKPQKTTQTGKYLQVRLFNQEYKKGRLFYIHRLVWENLKGEIPPLMTIDHKDGNPANNNINNLQLMSLSENSSKFNGRKKKLWDLRDEILAMHKSGLTQPEIAEHFNCSVSHIWRVINGKVQTRKNGKWIYKDLM
jgi:hypothetical protein